MADLKPSLLFVVIQEASEFNGSLDAFVELLAGQHFVEDVASTKDIALLIVRLLIPLVYLLDVNLRSRVNGRASLEGHMVSLLDLAGNTEIGNLEFSRGSEEQVVGLEVAVEQSYLGKDLRFSFI